MQVEDMLGLSIIELLVDLNTCSENIIWKFVLKMLT